MVDRGPDVSIEACARTLRERLHKATQRIEARAESLREQARVAAGLLAVRHGAKRVWLFGSLAWGQPHQASDVDLLVEGIAADAWLAAIKTVEDAIEAPVDVLRAEDAPPGLRLRVAEEGRLIHGQR
jgi:predicted nucleotidyltransferase